MARFTQSPCDKGSQKWIQTLINDQPEHLNSQIKAKLNLSKDERIQWLSPLKDDEYSEYCDREFIDLLGVKLKEKPLSDFWSQVRGLAHRSMMGCTGEKLFREFVLD